MSKSPLEWHQDVISHYGSLASFQDRTTVTIVREQIAAKRKDHKYIFDMLDKIPGVMRDEDLQEMKDNDAALASLDAELEQWQRDREQTVS